jgi:chromate transporter
MVESASTTRGLAPAPSLGRIIDFFGRYGNFTLGGGSATSAVMHRELVTKRRWLTDDSFALCFALGRLTPGTNLLANCTALGWLLRRLPGAVSALLAASIPCALMVVVLTALFSAWQENHMAQAAIHGAVAAAVAITAKTSWTIARPHFKGGARLRVIIIGAAAFGAYAGLGVPAIYILLLSGVVGAFLPAARS